MSQTLIFTLLILALGLPIMGALVLRVLRDRLDSMVFYAVAALFFGAAAASVLALARSDVRTLQVGRLSVLLPVASGEEVLTLPVEPTLEERSTLEAALTPTATPGQAVATEAVATATLTPKPTLAPTETPTITPSPTLEPTEEPTPEPPTPEPPTPEPAPESPRTYTVQPGDTLRGIAEQFGVSVEVLIEANDLTPEEADSLQIGQELVIPTE